MISVKVVSAGDGPEGGGATAMVYQKKLKDEI
jgi:hypothetical protein